MASKRRRRKKDVFDPDKILPKYVISISDLGGESESPPAQSEDKETAQEPPKPAEVFDASQQESSSLPASEDEVIPPSGKEKEMEEPEDMIEKLTDFNMEEDILLMQEETQLNFSIESNIFAGEILQESQSSLADTKKETKESEDIKLEDLLDISSDNTFGSLMGEPLLSFEKFAPLKDEEQQETESPLEEKIEERVKDENPLDMIIPGASLNTFSMPSGDLKDMFREEVIQDDVFSRLAELQEDRQVFKEEVETAEEPEASEETVPVEKSAEESPAEQLPQEEEFAAEQPAVEEAPAEAAPLEELLNEPAEAAIEEAEEEAVLDEPQEPSVLEEKPEEKPEEKDYQPDVVDEELSQEELKGDVVEVIIEEVSETPKEDESVEESQIMEADEDTNPALITSFEEESAAFTEESIGDSILVYRKPPKSAAETLLKHDSGKSVQKEYVEEETVIGKAEDLLTREVPCSDYAAAETPEEEAEGSAPYIETIEEVPEISEISKPSREEEELIPEIKAEPLEEEAEMPLLALPAEIELPITTEEEPAETIEEEPAPPVKMEEEIAEADEEAAEEAPDEKAASLEEGKPADPDASQLPYLELFSKIDGRVSSEIISIKKEISIISRRLKDLEEMKEELRAAVPGYQAPKKPALPKKASIPQTAPPSKIIETISPQTEDEMEISVVPLPDFEEGELTFREKQAVKKEVDDMLSAIEKIPIEKEIQSLLAMVREVPVLAFLKPRIAEAASREDISYKTLTSLYRIALRFMKEELQKKETDLDRSKAEFAKYKKQSSRLQTILQTGEKPAYGKKEEAGSGDLFVLREEIKKKDKIISQQETQIDRLKMDFNNVKGRQQKEIDRLVSKNVEEMLLNLLGVMDNFERALEYTKSDPQYENVGKGFEMILNDLMSKLSKYNLMPINAVGFKFDPNFHEALTFEETDEASEDTVLTEIRKGYLMGNKVIRPAQVKIAKKPSTPLSQTKEAAPPSAPSKLPAESAEKEEGGKREVSKDSHAAIKIEDSKKEEEQRPIEKSKDEGYTLEAFFGASLDDLKEMES